MKKDPTTTMRALAFWTLFREAFMKQRGAKEDTLAMLNDERVVAALVEPFERAVAARLAEVEDTFRAMDRFNLRRELLDELLVKKAWTTMGEDEGIVLETGWGTQITIHRVIAPILQTKPFEELVGEIGEHRAPRVYSYDPLITPANFPHEATAEPGPTTIFYVINFGEDVPDNRIEARISQLGRTIPERAVQVFSYAAKESWVRPPVVSLRPVGQNGAGEPIVLVRESRTAESWLETTKRRREVWPANYCFLTV